MNEGGQSRLGDDEAWKDEASDDNLLMATARGDRAAFRRLMERHTRGMVALAQRITGNAADADEVVQDTFLKLWSMAGRWRPETQAKLSTWIYRVTLNACIDRRRKTTFLPLEDAGDPPDPAQGGLDRAMARESHEVVRAFLDRLPRRQKEALVLYYFGEMTAPQAARVMEMSVPAFEALLVRGKRGLKRAMTDQGLRGTGDIL